MKTIALVISLLFISMTYANNNHENKPKSFSISGKVVDNKESLTGVKIMIDGKETTIYTDFDGNFILDNVLEGEHTISFSLITYNSKEVTFNPKNNNKLEIKLEAK